MDFGTVIVLVLMLGAAVFLVFAERNSRRNEAKLKAESSAKPEPNQSSERPLDLKSSQETKKANLN